MSILTVKNLNHGFGDRALFKNVSFRLLKGEHIGLVGDNGEGKSTFMNIIANKLIPDEGTIEWSKKVSVGYMDQHIELESGKSVRDVLREAFQNLFDLEKEMNKLYSKIDEINGEEMNKALQRAANIQETLETKGFYNVDSRIEEVAFGLGLEVLD